MSLYNASVTLTLPLGGVLTSKGVYEYKEKTTTGSILPEGQRLFIKNRAIYSDCYRKVELGETFVNHAISNEGRPDKNENFKVYASWKKMSQMERLVYHINKYAYDMRAYEFTYQIHQG